MWAPPQIVSTPGHNAPITRVMMNHEETLLFTGGEDGLVMVWQVSDREGKLLHISQIAPQVHILVSRDF